MTGFARFCRSLRRPALAGAAIVLAAAVTLVPEARAACTDKTGVPVPRSQPTLPKLPLAGLPAQLLPPTLAGHDHDKDDDSIVGLWYVVFKQKDGSVWDHGFQQYHADGTEITIDNAVPPSLGNVCIGVWRQDGKTIKLRHVTWNWNPDGTPAGTFLLISTIKLDRNGDAYEGSFVSDSFDLNNHVIPELHAEGPLKGTRIKVG